jgi:hypothetical protein
MKEELYGSTTFFEILGNYDHGKDNAMFEVDLQDTNDNYRLSLS